MKRQTGETGCQNSTQTRQVYTSSVCDTIQKNGGYLKYLSQAVWHFSFVYCLLIASTVCIRIHLRAGIPNPEKYTRETAAHHSGRTGECDMRGTHTLADSAAFQPACCTSEAEARIACTPTCHLFKYQVIVFPPHNYAL